MADLPADGMLPGEQLTAISSAHRMSDSNTGVAARALTCWRQRASSAPAVKS